MKNTKLYAILQRFDRYEQNRLRKYLQSPYFNRDEALVSLFELLIKNINKPTGNGTLGKERVWKKIKADSAFDDVRFRKYCSDLLKLVEGFLAQAAFEREPFAKPTYLVKAIGQRKLEALYSNTTRRLRQISEGIPHRDAEYYYHQYSIEKSYFDLADSALNRSDKNNLESIGTNLDYFYIAEKLRLYITILSQQFTTKYNYEFHFIDEILDIVRNNPIRELPLIAIYSQMIATHLEPNVEEHYFKLKQLLKDLSLKFTRKESSFMYNAAQNYCILKVNQGNPKFLEEYFELYQDLISKDMLIDEDGLEPWKFKNIILAGLRLGKYQWVENFIGEYEQYLPEEHRKNAVTYNLAQLYFYQKKYEQVLQQLQFVEYEDPAYNLNSKSMMIATYYELDEIEPLDSLFQSFRAYLNRHQKDIPEKSRQRYINLIKFTKKLTNIRPKDKQAIEKLKKEIDESGGVVSVNWLKEKISELE